MSFKTGFICIIGKPNTGKSSLLNALLGQKLAIATPKAQTTRNSIQAVLTTDKLQAILIDTPGYSTTNQPLKSLMHRIIQQALLDTESVICLFDGSTEPNRNDQTIATWCVQSKKPYIILLNKFDLLEDKQARKNRENEYLGLFESSENQIAKPHWVSAKTAKGLKTFLDLLEKALPEGSAIYDEDTLTPMTIRDICAEIIREKVLELTTEEVPHATAVVIEQFDENQNKLTKISAILYVERDSQKPILIGKNAQTIKQIGTLARKDIEALLENKVFLDLSVKVKDNWRKDRVFLNTLGLSQ